MKTHSEVTCA